MYPCLHVKCLQVVHHIYALCVQAHRDGDFIQKGEGGSRPAPGTTETGEFFRFSPFPLELDQTNWRASRSPKLPKAMSEFETRP